MSVPSSFNPASPALGLELRPPGIWFTRIRRQVSYPADGNSVCHLIEDRSFWFQHRNRCIATLVKRFAPEATLLDIGGGNGFVASGLREAGIDCALLEPGLEGALVAHARGVDPVICGSLEDVAFPLGSFASVGMFDVLEHIEDASAALGQVHRLLAPGGHLFVSVPAWQFLFSSEDRDVGHFRRYSPSGLREILERAGFETIFRTCLFSPLPLPVLMFRAIPSWFGGRRSHDLREAEAEHVPSKLVGRILNFMLDSEFRRLVCGRSVPFGTSSFAVGRRA
jgi:SAM-dependent methyltransferase